MKITKIQTGNTVKATAQQPVIVKKGYSPFIQDGTWWQYDETVKGYVDTGITAEGKDGRDGADGQDGRDFRYEDFTAEQLAALRGDKGDPGKDGEPGKNGKDGIDGKNGSDGKDGYTPVKGIDYFDGEPGQPGKDGADGKAPVKGVDYFTDSEIAEFKKDVTPVKGIDYRDGIDGQDGRNGTDGKTPIKGTDYFTASEIADFKYDVTPQKGIDYFTSDDESELVKELLNQFPGKSISNATKATNDANGVKITPVYNTWNQNLGSPSLFEAATIYQEFGCKSDFLPRSNITYEISADFGETWQEFQISDEDHANMWGGTNMANVKIPKFVDLTDESSNPYMFRMTITPISYVYINMFYMYGSGNGSRYHVKYEAYKKQTDTWYKLYETSDYVTFGWPGHNVLYHGNVPFSASSISSHYNKIRITINAIPEYRVNVDKYPTWLLYKIRLLGGYPFQTDINGMKINGLDKRFIFPAGIQLGGDSGTILTQDKLKKLLALIS